MTDSCFLSLGAVQLSNVDEHSLPPASVALRVCVVDRAEAPVKRICGYDTPFPLVHEKYYVPDERRCFGTPRTHSLPRTAPPTAMLLHVVIVPGRCWSLYSVALALTGMSLVGAEGIKALMEY